MSALVLSTCTAWFCRPRAVLLVGTKPGFHMICNGRRRSAILIGNQSASCPDIWKLLKRCLGRSPAHNLSWLEELNLILLSRPLRPCRQRKILMGARVWNGLRHTIWMIGRVELDSTFPTITTTPTKKDFNGNACLERSATIGDISLFLLNHASITAQWELRLLPLISNHSY